MDEARPTLIEPRLRIPFIFCSLEGPGQGLGSRQAAGGLGTVPAEMGKDPSQSLHFFHHCRPRAVGKTDPIKLTALPKQGLFCLGFSYVPNVSFSQRTLLRISYSNILVGGLSCLPSSGSMEETRDPTQRRQAASHLYET